jgi:hypothetical protein
MTIVRSGPAGGGGSSTAVHSGAVAGSSGPTKPLLARYGDAGPE